MKKLLGILVLGLLLCNNSFAVNTKGKGEVKLSYQSVNYFVDYLSGKIVKGERWTPMFFILSSDGSLSYYQYCPYSSCRDSGVSEAIAWCERTSGVTCWVFARRRTVVWDNGMNMPRKEKKFMSKWSSEEVKTQLEKLGFYGDGTTQTEKIEKKKVEKKKKPKKKMNDDLVKQLKDLNELYESGVLTEEEFNKAKKKLLN